MMDDGQSATAFVFLVLCAVAVFLFLPYLRREEKGHDKKGSDEGGPGAGGRHGKQ